MRFTHFLPLAGLSWAAAVPASAGSGSPVALGPITEGEARSLVGVPVPQVHAVSAQQLAALTASAREAPLPPFQGSLNDTELLGRFVNGPDDRTLYTGTAYPYRTNGKIIFNSGYCSGVLIGPRHIITAKHCMHPSEPTTIHALYDQGTSRVGKSSWVTQWWYLTTNIDFNNLCTVRNDFAIGILNDRIGDSLGWMGVVADPSPHFNANKMISLGYPSDKSGGQRPYQQVNFNIRDFSCSSGNPIVSLADTAPGQSGSAVYFNAADGPYVTAVHSAQNPSWSWYAHSSAFVGLVRDTRAKYP